MTKWTLIIKFHKVTLKISSQFSRAFPRIARGNNNSTKATPQFSNSMLTIITKKLKWVSLCKSQDLRWVSKWECQDHPWANQWDNLCIPLLRLK